MVYNNINKVELTRAEFDRLQDFLKVNFEDETQEQFIDAIGAVEDDLIYIGTFKFENGNKIFISLISGDSNYYDSSWLLTADECDTHDFDCGYEIDEDMQFEYNGDLYNCHITITD